MVEGGLSPQGPAARAGFGVLLPRGGSALPTPTLGEHWNQFWGQILRTVPASWRCQQVGEGWHGGGPSLPPSSGPQWGPEPPQPPAPCLFETGAKTTKPHGDSPTLGFGVAAGAAQGLPRSGDRGDLARTSSSPPIPTEGEGTLHGVPGRSHPTQTWHGHTTASSRQQQPWLSRRTPLPNIPPQLRGPTGTKPPSCSPTTGTETRSQVTPSPPRLHPSQLRSQRTETSAGIGKEWWGGGNWKDPPPWPCPAQLPQPRVDNSPEVFFHPGMMTKKKKKTPKPKKPQGLPASPLFGGARRRVGHFTAGKLRHRRVMCPVSHGPGWAEAALPVSQFQPVPHPAAGLGRQRCPQPSAPALARPGFGREKPDGWFGDDGQGRVPWI